MFKSLFALQSRLEDIDASGDPLKKLNEAVDWNLFRPELDAAREKERKSNAGCRPYDSVLMFKILLLQALYNLSHEAVEKQILDRLSFMRFLGLSLDDDVPDSTTIWNFRELLAQRGVVQTLFGKFDAQLRAAGFQARKGQIIDASIVSMPKPRNTPEETAQIKVGQTPTEWSPAKRSQKDTDARWAKKNGHSFFGYKNHVCVDVENKLIRGYVVTPAAVHDSQVFEELLDPANANRSVWADAAYRSARSLAVLAALGFREHLQRGGCRNRKLTERERRGNRTRATIRSRVEHVFGVQAKRAGTLILRAIGIVRARAVIGLRNLAYNLDRYATLRRLGVAARG